MERKRTIDARCAANCAAWWAFHGFVPPDPVEVEADRCWYERTPQILAAIGRLVAGGKLLPAPARNHGSTVESGYREDVGRCSAQVIIHRARVEMDFDLRNPRDVVGIIGHTIEIANNRFRKKRTDQARVAKLLRARGIVVNV